MPPKQQSKADLAKKQKIVEDKTFGLKNKNKSKNVQKYVQTLKQSVQPQSDPSKTAAKVPSLHLFFRWSIFIRLIGWLTWFIFQILEGKKKKETWFCFSCFDQYKENLVKN